MQKLITKKPKLKDSIKKKTEKTMMMTINDFMLTLLECIIIIAFSEYVINNWQVSATNYAKTGKDLKC